MHEKIKGPSAANAEALQDTATSNNNNKPNAHPGQDLAESISFLNWLRPGGPWTLTAIDPDGKGKDKIETRTLRNAAAVAAFVRRHNGAHNLYFAVNPLLRPINKKAEKTDIARVEFVLADADPKDDEASDDAKHRYLDQLRSGKVPAPSAIINSGNGIQALWRLATPIEFGPLVRNSDNELAFSPDDQQKVEHVEAISKAMMSAIDAKAGTQNIDRILRLPGTTNLPNGKKRDAGRVACPTKLLDCNDSTFPLDAFPSPVTEAKSPSPAVGAGKNGDASLPRMLSALLHLPTAAGYPSRSELLFAFVTDALRKGIDASQIVAACLDPAYRGNAIFQHVADNNGERYVKQQIEHALNKIDAAGDRALIRIEDGKLDEAWRATQRALIKARCPVFVRGDALVQPLWRWEPSDEGNADVLSARLLPYNVPRLSDVVAHHAATFQKFDHRAKRWKAVDPPEKLIERLIEVGHWDFSSIVGIITSPTMRADCSIITEPGYDERTRLWYTPAADVELPAIADQPSRADAETALALLNDLLSGFPFADEVARSVALAALMTAVLRGAMQAAPIFAVVAPMARTGKTFLVQLISVLATGHPSVLTAGSRSGEELEKRIETAALSGRQILHLNNLPNGTALDSEALSQLSTEGRLTIRLLGRNTEASCDCRSTTIFVNGNNIRLAADLVPRTPICRLDAKSEAPENRTWTFDPMQRVRARRGDYLAAVFTVAKAFNAAGAPRPPELRAVAGYDAWSRLVQQPLIWLGMEDPFAGMESARATDPMHEEACRLLDVLKKYSDELGQFEVADCARLAEEREIGFGSINRLKRPDLHELMSPQGKINAKAFGRLLSRFEGYRVEGYYIATVPTGRGRRRYVVRRDGSEHV